MCSKCNEENDDFATKCWKCESNLGTRELFQKKCFSCNQKFPVDTEECSKCGGKLKLDYIKATELKPAAHDADNKIIKFFLAIKIVIFLVVIGILIYCLVSYLM